MSRLKRKAKELAEKWNAKSPKKNRILTNICTGIVTVAGLIVAIPLAIPASIVVLPTALVSYATVTVFVGGALGVKSKLTVEKPKKEEEKV